MECMKRCLLFFLLTVLGTSIWAQDDFKSISVKAGFSSFAPDDRLFPYSPWLEDWFASAAYPNDQEFCLLADMRFGAIGKIEGRAGVGYSIRMSKFPTIVNQSYFGTFHKPIYMVEEYRRHSAVLPLSLSYNFLSKKDSKASVGFLSMANFVFRKSIKSENSRFSKAGIFNLNSVELGPSISYGYKRLQVIINYRLLNYNRPDYAILSVYNIPQRSNHTGIEPHEVAVPHDFYNPTRIWLILGYDLYVR